MTNRNESSALARVWRQLNPENYYEAGEIAILRAYFGLKPRPGDMPLAELYEAPTDESADADPDAPRMGPIRLRHIEATEQVNELNEAVARICLAEVQERLPQWSSSSAEHGVRDRARALCRAGAHVHAAVSRAAAVHQLGRLGPGLLVAGGIQRHAAARVRALRADRVRGLARYLRRHRLRAGLVSAPSETRIASPAARSSHAAGATSVLARRGKRRIYNGVVDV